jgi:Mce-associated membrane protein
MVRQRPLAGQRNRPRPGTPSARPSATRPATPRSAGPVVLDRPSAPAGTADATTTTGTGRRPDWLLLVAGVVTLALVLTAGLVALRARTAARTETARTAAQAAAESDVVDLLSYDYRHLDRDFARARSHLTGRFVADYTTTTQHTVRPLAPQVHAVVKATVASSSVVRASENKVVVLLFVNQTTTSTRLDAPRTDLNRVRLTMTRVGGGWKVSKVAAL